MKLNIVTVILILVISLMLITPLMAEVGYYSRVWLKTIDLSPKDSVTIYMTLEVRDDAPRAIGQEYTLSLFRLDPERLQSTGGKEIQYWAPVKTWKKRVAFKIPRDTSQWRESREEITFRPEGAGYYKAELKFGSSRNSLEFPVSDAGVVAKSSREEMVLFVQDKRSGAPLPDARIDAVSGGTASSLGTTGQDGLLQVSFKDVDEGLTKNNSFMIVARKDKELAVCQVNRPGTVPAFKAYVFTDRPIYRPEQKVYFKGILRQEKDGGLLPVAGEKVKVEVKDPRGGKILEKEMTTGEFGSLSDHLILGEEPPLGNYTVSIQWKEQTRYGGFKVEEYRKPEYEITVAPRQKFLIQGDRAAFDLSCSYYFGAPVADTEFTYTVTRQEHYPYRSYYWWEDMPYYHYGSRQVTTGKGRTGKDGKALVEFDTEKAGTSSTYNVTVAMTDESRRMVSGTGAVTVTPGRFYILMSAEKYFYSPADRVKVRVETKDYDGNPCPAPVEITVTKKTWQREKGYETQEILKKTVTTDEKGKGVLEFVPDRVGYFEIKAAAKDDAGNAVSGYASFYSAKDTREQWFNFPSMEISPDKAYYEYGEPIRLMITNPSPGSSALLTVECDRIYESRVIEFDSSVKVVELTASPRHAPNVYVTLAFWHKGKLYRAARKIIVPAADKFLDVSVKTDKSKYRPRNTASYSITTRSKDGTPVSCEVAMGIADESVYAVEPDKTPNIQKFFFGERYNRVVTTSSHIMGGYDYDDKGAPEGTPLPLASPANHKTRGRNGGSVMAEPEFVREFFPDTCYFNPFIITDHEGKATVGVSLPDNLTTWRATARAASRNTQVGEAIHKVTVSKDLLVRLITPRFLVEGDTCRVSALAHNYLDTPMNSEVSLAVDGLEAPGPLTSKVLIDKNGKSAVEWAVKALKSGRAKLTVKALTTKESDAMALTIPVHPHGVKGRSAAAGSGTESLELAVELPANAASHSATLKISLSPSLAGTLIPALDYLAGFPYGCVEQTLSRFIPNAVVQSSLQEFGIRNEKLEKELPQMMKAGFDKLYGYHHADGGWGWWKNDQSHPFMTAYVVYGLSLAGKSGHKVDKSKVTAGANWLKENYSKEKEPGARAYMLFAMSEAGVYEKDRLKVLFDQYPKLDNYSRAILAIALHRSGNRDHAEAVLKSLEKTVVERNTVAFWKGPGTRSWMDSPVETTAYVIKAYILINPKSPLLEKAVRYITLQRGSGGWQSTKDTAAAVLAVIDYVKMTKEANPEYSATLSLNGKELKTVSFTRNDIAKGGVMVEVPGEKLRQGRNVVSLTKKGPGVAYCSAELTYFTREESIKAESNGIKVKREYFLVKEKAAKDKAVSASRRGRHYPLPQSQDLLIPLEASKPMVLSPQDMVEVKITLEGDMEGEYLMVEDFKPAGCEAVPEKTGYWGWWYAQKEFRDEKTAFFATRFHKGSQVLTYRMRAETPGTYRVLPATASLMYIPDVGGRSDEAIITVK
jgi:hypothetical protein